MPINSKIHKNKKKWDKEMAQSKVRYCNVIIIIILSEGVKQMAAELDEIFYSFNFCAYHKTAETRASAQWGTDTPGQRHFLMYKKNFTQNYDVKC